MHTHGRQKLNSKGRYDKKIGKEERNQYNNTTGSFSSSFLFGKIMVNIMAKQW